MKTDLSFVFTNHCMIVPSPVKYHSHSVYEFVYYLEGRGCLNTDDNSYNYAPGTVLIFKPNVAHDEIHYAPTISLCLGYAALDDEADFEDDVTVISAGSNPNILSCAQMIVSEYDSKNKYYEQLCNSLLNTILVYAKRIHHGSETMVTPAYFVISKLNQAWDRTSDADIAEIWNSYLQEYSGYSYDRFRHKFKKDTGMSPNQFLLQLRIHKACWLLKETTMNVTEIALACGFSSCSYFTQQFRKSTGIAPSHYRTRLAATHLLFTDFPAKSDQE